MKIAIDGPAGAGKSTVAKMVADKLGYLYVDTGAMYRALTWKALHDNVDISSGEALVRLLNQCRLELQSDSASQRVVLNGRDITEAIRTREVSNHVSEVASHPQVREAMVELQREMATKGNVVMDGRDIGTYVIPDADVKIYLTASLEERARRRYEELRVKGHEVSFEEIKQEILERDDKDRKRDTAPLQKAADALTVDTTGLSITEVVNCILNIVHQKT
ncbi:(d)CMP kinase [Caldalkalibacillus thermarum TA2.A1]|uniref:Cytidylate kinase n=1 Tax=Caldalkalibacillus thermarum (strain TA2.A1) TaxID=986075 RepID=A0A8X8I6S9_CALTT|nr:(d)CMP kinase [Caldalkalibacillus thermarum]QZT32623.1 (d)CMP kinase [Caldalkalibacillus thermarum TA2.A1]